MKKGGGRRKGKRGERNVSNFFNEWAKEELAKLPKDADGKSPAFRKVPGSGSMRWARDNRIIGDVVIPLDLASKFPFTIESKRVASLDFHHLIDGVGCNILKFWDQALTDSRRAKLLPILFMHSTDGMGKKDFFVAMPKSVFVAWEKLDEEVHSLEVWHSDNENYRFMIVNSFWVSGLDFRKAMALARGQLGKGQ